jgi:protocatechuate 3,4-dioxygenase beta subunit
MLFVVSMLSAALLAGQTPAAAPAQISGRVFAEGSNTPLAGARVVVVRIQRTMAGLIGPPPETTTDQTGHYAFLNLTPGEYSIEARQPGFAQNSDDSTRKMVTVAAGQAIEDVDIWLARGGAIAGRIVDATGAPMAELRVMVLRHVDRPGMEGRLLPAAGQGQQTNDLGEFRVYGLPAGTYYVAAAPMMMLGGSAATSASRSAPTVLATTFYPGTTDSATAQPVTVSPGDTASNISFAMQSTIAFRVSGVVTDESGAAVSGATVMLTNDPRKGAMFFGPAARATSDSNGQFVVAGVSPGNYRAIASVPIMVRRPSGGAPPPAGVSGGVVGGVTGGVVFGTTAPVGGSMSVNSAMTQASPVDVAVADADVTGLRLVVARR